MEKMLRKFAKGEVIYTQGEYEESMYVLRRGKVGIYADYGKGTQKLWTILNAEDGNVTFGEMELIEAMARSATAVALEDVEAYFVTRDDFGNYFKDDPEAILLLMRNMGKRIRELTQDYMDACQAAGEMIAGREKSSWFKKIIEKLVEDCAKTTEILEQGSIIF